MTIKVGATVDIPRVAFPCIYVHPDVRAVTGNFVSYDDSVYPVLPALIDREYCSPFNIDVNKFVKSI